MNDGRTLRQTSSSELPPRRRCERPMARARHSPLRTAQRMPSAPSLARAHVVELLAPLYANVPLGGHDVVALPAELSRTGDDWLQLEFPTLARAGKALAEPVVCVNHESGCRCDFVRLLRSLLVLRERHVLAISIKYVVATMRRDGVRTATLQLFVALDDRAPNVASLADFELVLSHLQSGVKAIKNKHDDDAQQLEESIENARLTRCHVVGCELHPYEAQAPRFTLDDVFHRLTTHVQVEQMPIRDDETYAARMKKARRDVLLTDMPIPALHTFIRMLDARDLAAVSGVCSMFQHLAYEVVPGLKLLLYSHQRRGLRWLLYREGSGRRDLTEMAHPFVFPAQTLESDANPQDVDSDSNVIDLIDGRLVKQATVPLAADCRGGLFCDEPGLGKTITMLALILRTKGQRSDPCTLVRDDLRGAPRIGMSLRSAGSRGRELNTQRLKASATSLIVVPNPLLDHWRYQIATHVAHGVLKVFVDDVEFKGDLPSAEELATYDVVITSFGRLTDEWKYRRPKSALEERRPERFMFEDGPDRFVDGFVNRGTSPLLMVHWIRIIVDEGHKLGGTNQAYHMRMARLFHADKRWVMTGTPTPNTLQSADLRHMHGLLVFLRDRPYGEADGKAWLKAIAKPFEQNERAGYVRLLHLLNRIMMRHTKESVHTLIPAPVRHVVLIDPTPKEYAMYNGVAAAVRANLVITNKDPHTPGKLHLDSLLNPIHRRWAKQVTVNLRLATCGGGQIKATLTRESFAETVNMLNSNGVDPERVNKVIEFMRKAESIDVLSLCTMCGRHLQLLMLLPCGHMACADCVESRVEAVGPSCGICDTGYDWEFFQMLQPGFEFSSVEEKWEYDEGPLAGIGHGNVTAPNGFGAQGQDPPAQRRRARPNDGSTIPVREQNGNRRRIIPIDLTRFVTVNASKAFYVASRITELRKEFARHDPRDAWSSAPPRPKVVKAIIFSQFKEHIWRVKVALAQQGIQCADFITGVSPAMRMAGLLKFRNDPDSNVLVLTDVGSHGLDLSFVTHIFLMDEIWDKSLEKQVIARAHRMGARHSVVVEQLLMRSSVEEIMHEMNKRERYGEEPDDTPGGGGDDSDNDETPQASAPHQPGSRAMKGFFAGENKLKSKRLKNRQSQTSKGGQNEPHSKSSMQHRQFQHLLQNLRLIEESTVSEFGIVKFQVLDNDGQRVRSASLRLPNPGKPPTSMVTESTGPHGTGAPPATGTQSSSSQPSSVQADQVVVSGSSAPNSVDRPSNGKQKMTTSRPRVQFQDAPQSAKSAVVVDLTSDGDSPSEKNMKVQSRSMRTRFAMGLQTSYSYTNGSDEDYDDDDDWNPGAPRRVSSARIKSNGKGKQKRVRLAVEEGSDDE